MGTLVKTVHRACAGRILVQVLIMTIIVGAMAVIIIPNIWGLVGTGEPEAAKTELSKVQSAITTMMNNQKLTTVTAVTKATKDMRNFPENSHPLFPDYFFVSQTQGTYTCDEAGKITQVITGY
jgi:hypothetical protein